MGWKTCASFLSWQKRESRTKPWSPGMSHSTYLTLTMSTGTLSLKAEVAQRNGTEKVRTSLLNKPTSPRSTNSPLLYLPGYCWANVSVNRSLIHLNHSLLLPLSLNGISESDVDSFLQNQRMNYIRYAPLKPNCKLLWEVRIKFPKHLLPFIQKQHLLVFHLFVCLINKVHRKQELVGLSIATSRRVASLMPFVLYWKQYMGFPHIHMMSF